MRRDRDKMKYAVIDMGTNVFAALVAEQGASGCCWKGEYKVAARLGDGGLVHGQLSEPAFVSAHTALEKIFEWLQSYEDLASVRAYATSAFREAANGPQLQQILRQHFSIPIEIISGDREAELIAKGILAAVPELPSSALLMDIGGGSCEFILLRHKKIAWKCSFPLGMARILERFQPSDPIQPATIAAMRAYCREVLQPLQRIIDQEQPQCLVGSSGSFETFRDLLYPTHQRISDPEFVPSVTLDRPTLEKMFQDLIRSKREERMQLRCMTPVRVDFIVLAAVFTQLVLDLLPAGIQIKQSSFSLKEGAMVSLLDEAMY